MKVDYSPKAVTRRLCQAEELRSLCLALAGPRLKWSWRRTAPDAPMTVRESPDPYAAGAGRDGAGGQDVRRGR